METLDPGGRIGRRSFVKQGAAATAGLTLAPVLMEGARGQGSGGGSVGPAEWSCNLFSKHLQFLDYDEAADACREAGYHGTDLSVRPKGHVQPENVEQDLPRAVRAFGDAGLKIPMMVTAITDPEDPLSERVLSTAAGLGIRYYRMGYYRYDTALSIQGNLELIRKKMEGLAVLNERYRIHGAYQNHAGNNFGAPVWDIWQVIRDMDPRWTGCQYDIRHATAEGNRSWPLAMRALKDHIRCLVIKDFRWEEHEGRAREVNVPVGEGVVDFPAFFGLVKELGIRGPISVHVEYPMFPEEGLNRDAMKARAIKLIRRDLDTLKSYL